MSVNLKKNEAAILAAYKDVLNDSTDTNWAVFGYEGNSNDIKVVETGDGGWEEMIDELSGGKIMYAFCRVLDPNTKLPKNVMVNWSGEGVPTSRKGACARHVTDVNRFFKGIHVTINARHEDDLDESIVLEKVSKASGANFSFHKEKAKAIPEQGKVGSVWQRHNPQQEIDTRERDSFWSKQEQEEEKRTASEKRAAAELKKKEELERREREEVDARKRDAIAKERAKKIDEQKQRETAAQRREREENESQLQTRLAKREAEVDSELEAQKRQQRQQQAQSRSVSGGLRDKLAGFEKKAEEQRQPPPRPKPTRAPPKQFPRKPEPEPEPEPRYEPEPQYEPEPEPEPEPEEYEPEPEPEYQPEPEPEYQPEPEPEYQPEPEPEYEPEPEEPDQDLYDDVAPGAEEPYYDDTQQQQEDIYDDVQEVQPPPVADEEPIYDDAGVDEGLKARTVFDYEAADDTEITFDIDEIITNIEQIDEGWWRGVRQLDGSYGLFPANYVELI